MAQGPTTFAYPARMTRQADGRWLVRFRDIPEALTDGADKAEAAAEASDALSAALLARVATGDALPDPSPPKRGETVVAPYPAVALKAALARILAATPHPAATLAGKLHIDHKEARRILDPHHPTKLPRLAEAIASTGHIVHVAVTAADAPPPWVQR